MSKAAKFSFRKELALRTQAEVALMLGIASRSVQQIEQRALLHVKRALIAESNGEAVKARHTRSRKSWRVAHRPAEAAALEYFAYELEEWRSLAGFWSKYGAAEEANELRGYVEFLQRLIKEAKQEFGPESGLPHEETNL